MMLNLASAIYFKGAVDGRLYRVEYDDPKSLLSVEETLKRAN